MPDKKYVKIVLLSRFWPNFKLGLAPKSLFLIPFVPPTKKVENHCSMEMLTVAVRKSNCRQLKMIIKNNIPLSFCKLTDGWVLIKFLIGFVTIR